jgi:ParB family chromosome partitioning protein
VNSAELAADATYQPVAASPPLRPPPEHRAADIPPAETLRKIPPAEIGPNPFQPRQTFDPQNLAALTDSISRQGLLQPLVVTEDTRSSATHRYVLVAGERRLRAARQLGLLAVPCLVRGATQQQMLEWALIENIHRADLNPVERAEAYRNYIDRFHLTQDAAAERLGQARSAVSNCLRILDLCDEIRHMLLDGRLTFGHAKVLAGLLNQPARQLVLARKAAAGQLSVRKLEELVEAAGATLVSDLPATKHAPIKPPYIRDLEAQLSQAVGTRVTIQAGRAKNAGRITIDYYSLDDFDRIAVALGAKLEG